jgi:hypothetical protein
LLHLANAHWVSICNSDEKMYQSQQNTVFVLKLYTMPVDFTMFHILVIMSYCQKMQAPLVIYFPNSSFSLWTVPHFFHTNLSYLWCPFFQMPSGTPNQKQTNFFSITGPPRPISSLSGFEQILAMTPAHCNLAAQAVCSNVLCSNSRSAIHQLCNLGQVIKIFLASA